MAVFLEEPEGFESSWVPTNPDVMDDPSIQAETLEVPWYRDGEDLLTVHGPDGVAVGCHLEQGVVLLAVGSSATDATMRIGKKEETSGSVLALTPERALSLARQIARMARQAQVLRET